MSESITLPVLLTEPQAAQLLNLNPGTLNVWRCTRRHQIPYIKMGKAVRYKRDDLLAWIDQHTVTATD